jgi:hypothetical protein
MLMEDLTNQQKKRPFTKSAIFLATRRGGRKKLSPEEKLTKKRPFTKSAIFLATRRGGRKKLSPEEKLTKKRPFTKSAIFLATRRGGRKKLSPEEIDERLSIQIKGQNKKWIDTFIQKELENNNKKITRDEVITRLIEHYSLREETKSINK